MKSLFLTVIVTIALTYSCFAQTGIIRGKVIDGNNSEEIIGANVVIKGTVQGTATNIEGKFEIPRIEPGTYSLVVSFISYKTQTIENIKVEADKATVLNIKLSEDASQLEEVVIIGERETGTQLAVISSIKSALQVVSGISNEQIKLSQDKDAAQVLSRIPGITIVENRFVMVRGIPERYNQVTINNIIAPSTEIDRRTFSFDLIPSSALDRMLIFKSGSADVPGDFAGGLVKIYTKNATEENSSEVSFGLGYRAGTTFSDYFQSNGSNTDFLGFDNGFRTLPSGFPTQDALQRSPRNAQLRKDASDRLSNNWNPVSSMALPDLKLGYTINKFWKLNRMNISTTTSFNISQSYQYYQREFNRYFIWEEAERDMPITRRFTFQDDFYEKENRIGFVSNWQLKFNAFNKIEFKNLFNQIGENNTIIRNGTDFQQRQTDDLRNYLLGFRSRSIYNGQIEGTHTLQKSDLTLNWILGLNYLGESEPDLRRFRTFRSKTAPEGTPFTMQLPPSSNLFETGRYFGNMRETGLSNGVNINKKIGGTEERPRLLKAGYLVDYRFRDFSARYFSYLYPGFNDGSIGDSLSKLPLDVIFSPENVRTSNGFIIEEGTRTIDAYTASNFLTAGYVGVVYPLRRFNFSAGLRLENNIQRLDARNDFSPIEVNNDVTSILPFLNIDYSLTEKTQLRIGYGRTVNRPEFRELAPFLYYDYKLEAAKLGNPRLKTATIDNFDLRYEIYPRPGETISLGFFYKYFSNPIETQIVAFTESPGFSYTNADNATSYGAELEFRKSLLGVSTSKFLDKISVNLNASYIISEVTYILDPNTVGQPQLQDLNRPLQGQSPYIINAGLNYFDAERKLQVGASYNIFGDRIFAVGSLQFPTIYELPRHAVDITVTKSLSNGLTLKWGVQDLLNAQYRFYQDSNISGDIERDFNFNHPVFSYRRGTLYTFSASFKF